MARSRTLNVGNLLVVVLLAALAASLWVPHATARRVARIEGHAAHLARMLLQTARDAMPLDLSSAAAADALVEELRRRCLAAGHPPTTLPSRTAAPRADDGAPLPALCLQAKHYLLLLAETPPDAAAAAASKVRLLETYAWPRLDGAGHSAFFFAEEASEDSDALRTLALFSRNLDQGYAGLERAPQPGSARPRDVFRAGDYRGLDDQRWLPLEPPQKNSNR
jgi:hypothetical protein